MESQKNVIEIVKHTTNQFEYDEYRYFTEFDDKANILSTGDIWEATKFDDMDSRKQDALCKFIKSYYGKHYTVNIIPIKLTY